MSHLVPPTAPEHPSPRALVRSTVLAATAAAVLLVVAVLPAEYGWDPTGVGRLLGLTEMGEVKRALAQEAASASSAETASAAEAQALLAQAPAPAERADVTRVTLAADESHEVKLVMRAGADVTYSWSTDRGTVGFDLHGGPDATTSQSYKASASAWSDQGTLTARADGLHGWYWQNQTDGPVTITLRTDGAYLGVVRLD